jgi:thiol-disulfide isomerase/thioredoxin
MGVASCRSFILALLLATTAPLSAATLHEQMEALGIDTPRERLPAPSFELPALDDSRVNLEDYRGRLVLVHFWATFCESCRDEMPTLAALADRLAGQEVVVLAVAADRGNRRGVARFIQRYGGRLTVPLDADGDVRRQYEVEALPTTYLIGRDGRFIGRSIGEQDWNSPAFQALFDRLAAD